MRRVACSVVFALSFVTLVPLTLSATSFSILAGVNNTTAQTLGTGSGQTGSVAATGTLNVSGGSVAVTITGNNATLTNLGTIEQTGTGANSARVVRDNTGVTGLVINNGSTTNSTALMQAADADVIQMNKANASVTLNNYGTLESLNASKGGAQAVDFNAITNGANVVNNFSTGVIDAHDADAVRPGVNGVVDNAGKITVSVSSSGGNDGIDAQTNTGVTINNVQTDSTVTPTIAGARHGITGGNTDPTVNAGAYAMTVLNGTGALIQGNDGSGINIDGINGNELVTITNHGTITGNGVTGDGDGVDVDGLVNLTNTGTIKSLNALNDTSEGVTVGGGSITNSGTIEGAISTPANNTGTGRGITIAGVDKDANDNPIPIQAPYGATTIVNSGLIRGDSDAGIAFTSALASGFSNTITNMATGTIEGGGSAVALLTGADNDTVNNYGVIKADTSGEAINLGGGNNTLNILGGAASILGNIDGGAGGSNAMTIDPGAGHTFAYSGSIADFKTVQVDSGLVILSGVSTYTGTTIIAGGILELGIDNALSSSSDLDLDGGTLDLDDHSEGAAGAAGLGDFMLAASSSIDFGASGPDPVLDFSGLGTHASGAVLDILDYTPGLDHLYFNGLSSAFTSLFGQSDVCFAGLPCGYAVINDNGYYEVVPTPEPATLGLVGLGLIAIAAAWRRRVR